MSDTRAATRYARAVFELAQESNTLDSVHGDLAGLAGLIAANADLESFFTNPVIPTEKVVAVLETLLKPRVDALTYRFLLFLDSRDRLALIAEICDAFETMYLDHQGIEPIHITAAAPLTEQQVAGIVAAMKATLGKQPQATVSVDDRLIGGFRVRAGDTIYDHSIATQLDSLRKRIISA